MYFFDDISIECSYYNDQEDTVYCCFFFFLNLDSACMIVLLTVAVLFDVYCVMHTLQHIHAISVVFVGKYSSYLFNLLM